jgi:hypothetical protein
LAHSRAARAALSRYGNEGDNIVTRITGQPPPSARAWAVASGCEGLTSSNDGVVWCVMCVTQVCVGLSVQTPCQVTAVKVAASPVQQKDGDVAPPNPGGGDGGHRHHAVEFGRRFLRLVARRRDELERDVPGLRVGCGWRSVHRERARHPGGHATRFSTAGDECVSYFAAWRRGEAASYCDKGRGGAVDVGRQCVRRATTARGRFSWLWSLALEEKFNLEKGVFKSSILFSCRW